MKLADLARSLGLEVRGGSPEDVEITRLAALDDAGPGSLAYLAESRLAAQLDTTTAAAVICRADDAARSPVPCLVSAVPGVDFARASRLVAPRRRIAEGIHPTAVVSPMATVGSSVRIGAHVVVGDGCEIGDDVEIHANTTLYENVRIGESTLIQAGCVVREGSQIGARCILQPNVVVGSDGFGYARGANGAYEKIEQTGIVWIGDDTEIGAGTTIDRATFGQTMIGRGGKLDNLVQVGHNSIVGEDTVLCAQVGLAGSSRIGKGVTLAGQVGVAGHLEIGDGAIATAQTGIPNSVAAGALVSGYPAIDNRNWLKSSAVFKQLPDLHKTVRRLEKQVADLERRLGSEGDAANSRE